MKKYLLLATFSLFSKFNYAQDLKAGEIYVANIAGYPLDNAAYLFISKHFYHGDPANNCH